MCHRKTALEGAMGRALRRLGPQDGSQTTEKNFRESLMQEDSRRLDLSRLARRKGSPVAAMLKELEGRTKDEAPAWPARFLAIGGKRAAQRS